MNAYLCDDGNCEVEIRARTPEDAAQQYVDDGDWGDVSQTTWITVYVVDQEGNRDSIKIAIHPTEPKCTEGEHNWTAPYDLVGGLEENPGVHGHGGGVTIQEVCSHCGCGRLTDTWAQDPTDGEQGLESVSYEENWGL